MEFEKQDIAILAKVKEKSNDPAAVRDATSLYWSALAEGISNCLRKKTDISQFLQKEQDFVNFGISPIILEKPNDIRKSIGSVSTNSFIPILCFSDWISQLCAKIVQGDKKELLEKENALSRMNITRLEKENAELTQHRRENITSEPLKTSATRPQTDLQTGLSLIDQVDTLLRLHIKFKKAVAKGTFFSVTDKRKHCERENTIATLRSKSDGFLEAYHPNFRAAIKTTCTQIADNINRIIDFEESIDKINLEIQELAKKKDSISPIETEARIVKELDYLRDLVKLAAKRLHTDPSMFIRSEDKYFTLNELSSCLERVLEFDPQIFHNDRVAIFGKPSIVLIPGSGNAMFDWKNNIVIVPMIPPSGNTLASFATGMIEYRLDTDEDKKILNSYNQLPQHENVKSVFNLRADLTKDYITWMVSEYKGYKTLPKEVRKWFEHEIAPDRNDIYIPPQYQPFVCSTEEFTKQLDAAETLFAQGLETASENDLWIGSILNYQRGKFERSLELLKVLVAKNPANQKALYNLSHTSMKLMHKQDAIKGFTDYTKLNPQSWWSSIAMEQVRRLQVG